MLRPVSNLVAVSALPYKSPVTLPVISPVKSPIISALIILGKSNITLSVPSKLEELPECCPSLIVNVRVFSNLVAEATLSVK